MEVVADAQKEENTEKKWQKDKIKKQTERKALFVVTWACKGFFCCQK